MAAAAPPRWCKKCRALFGGAVCAEAHPIFMYTKVLPPEALASLAAAAAAEAPPAEQAPAANGGGSSAAAVGEQVQAEHDLRLSLQEEALEDTLAAERAEAELRITQEELASLRQELTETAAPAAAPSGSGASPGRAEALERLLAAGEGRDGGGRGLRGTVLLDPAAATQAPAAASPQPEPEPHLSPHDGELDARFAALGAASGGHDAVSPPTPLELAPAPAAGLLSPERLSQLAASEERLSAARSGVADGAPSPALSDDLDARLAALMASAPEPVQVAEARRQEQEASAAAALPAPSPPAAPAAVATAGRIAVACDWLASQGMSDADIRAIESHFGDQGMEFDVKALRGVDIDELQACLRSAAFRRGSSLRLPTAGSAASPRSLESSSSMASSASAAAAKAASIEGWLQKAGGWNTAWKKRYFKMEGTTLRYYGSLEQAQLRVSAKGAIDLRGLNRGDVQAVADKPLEFKLVTLGRAYHLKAADPASAQRWLWTLWALLPEPPSLAQMRGGSPPSTTAAASPSGISDRGSLKMDPVCWADDNNETETQTTVLSPRASARESQPGRAVSYSQPAVEEPEPEQEVDSPETVALQARLARLEKQQHSVAALQRQEPTLPEVVALSFKAEQLVSAALQQMLSGGEAQASELQARLLRWQRIAATKRSPEEAGTLFPRRDAAETPAGAVLGAAADITQALRALLCQSASIREEMAALEAQSGTAAADQQVGAGQMGVHSLQFVHRVASKQVVEPAQDLLWSCLLNITSSPGAGQEEELGGIDGHEFATAIRRLQSQGPGFFRQDAPFFASDTDFLVSPSEWVAAVQTLQRLRYVCLPAELLSTLLKVVKVINDTYRHEFTHKRNSLDGMSLDQLLPVLVFVVLAAHGAPGASDPTQCLTTVAFNGGIGPRYGSELAARCEMIRRLGEPEAMNGEAGYYLTVFYSAMSVISTQV